MEINTLNKRIILKGSLTGCILGIGLDCSRWVAAFYADRVLLWVSIVIVAAILSALLLLYRDTGYWEISFAVGVLFSSPFCHLLRHLPVLDWNKYSALRPSDVIAMIAMLSPRRKRPAACPPPPD